MPTYVYGIVDPLTDEVTTESFEVEQRMSDPPLTHHPTTGQPIRRIICAPFVAGSWSPLKAKRLLSNDQLAKKGFTKYVKTGNGYEKAAGSGPDTLARTGNPNE